MTQSVSAQVQAGRTFTIGERAFAASKIYSLTQLYFSGWKAVTELDPDIAYRNYLEKALAVGNRREFDLSTMEFVARLRNGHTVFSDAWLTSNYGQSLGFYARSLGRKWVVQNSRLPNVKPGNVVAKIDDVDAEVFFRQQQKYIAGSNEASQRQNLYMLPYLFPLKFTLTLEDSHRLVVDRTSTKTSSTSSASPEGRWLTQAEVAYIRMPSFAEPLYEEKALSYVFQFEKAKTLIIDVRNNTGGLIPRRLLKILMDRAYRDWKETTPIHISILELSDKINQRGQQKALPDFDRGYLAASAAFFGGSQLEWGGNSVVPAAPILTGFPVALGNMKPFDGLPDNDLCSVGRKRGFEAN